MPQGLHTDRRSLKHLAKLVATNVLPLPQYYSACAERLCSTERAEKLLIDTRAEIDAERAATAESAARWASEMIEAKRRRTMTAGRWVVEGGMRS